MNLNAIGKPFAVMLVGAVFALGTVACSSSDPGGGDAADGAGDPAAGADGPASADQRDISDELSEEQNAAGSGESFIGLSRDEAVDLAESEGRLWRVGAENGEFLPVTDDLRPGRVTFELEQGVVTGATVEQDLGPALVPPPGSQTDLPQSPLEDNADTAAILAAAVNQILTVDHSFGIDVPPPFSDVRVATVLGGEGGAPLAALQLEMIAATVQDTGAQVTFIDAPQALIEEKLESNEAGLAILTVGAVAVEADRAEVNLRLWCGGLCGVYLTYEVVPAADGGWEVAGTMGPIALS